MKKNIFFLSIFTACFITACKKPGCLGNAGSMTTAMRPLGSFSELNLDDNINLILVQSNEEKIEISAPENIVPNVTTIIENNTLTISNSTDCRWIRNPNEKINVKLFFKNITKLVYSGSGNISNADTLKLASLQIETTFGAGDMNLNMQNGYTGAYVFNENAHIKLHGSSDVCFTYTNARGMTDLKDYRVKKMVIEYGGLIDTYINVSDELDVKIFYSGNIYYKGTPSISRSEHYSTGRLIPSP